MNRTDGTLSLMNLQQISDIVQGNTE